MIKYLSYPPVRKLGLDPPADLDNGEPGTLGTGNRQTPQNPHSHQVSSDRPDSLPDGNQAGAR